MQLIHIPSESCPKCGIKGGTCSLVVNSIVTLETLGQKPNKKSFNKDFTGEYHRDVGDAYQVWEVDCRFDRKAKK